MTVIQLEYRIAKKAPDGSWHHQHYIAPQVATAAAAALSCHRWSRRTVYRPYAKPALRLWHANKSAIRSPGLPFNGLHLRNPCNYIDYYSFTSPKGMEGWVGLVDWPIADTLPTKWSYVCAGPALRFFFNFIHAMNNVPRRSDCVPYVLGLGYFRLSVPP